MQPLSRAATETNCAHLDVCVSSTSPTLTATPAALIAIGVNYQVLQPAIELGESGFPVSPITAYYWGRGAKQLKEQGGSGIKALLQPDGTAPKAGQLQKNTHLAATFRSLAEHGAEEGKP